MNLNCSPLFASLRYECLPWTRDSNARFIRDNETNTDVLIPLYQLKLGVSTISDLYIVDQMKTFNFLKKIYIYKVAHQLIHSLNKNSGFFVTLRKLIGLCNFIIVI